MINVRTHSPQVLAHSQPSVSACHDYSDCPVGLESDAQLEEIIIFVERPQQRKQQREKCQNLLN